MVATQTTRRWDTTEWDSNAKNGWMLPDGRIKPNSYGGHDDNAYTLGYEGEYGMERAGCVKLQMGKFLSIGPVSQTQLNSMYKYYAGMGLTMDESIEMLRLVEVE